MSRENGIETNYYYCNSSNDCICACLFDDTQIHTVTSGLAGSTDGGQIFDSGLLSPGATFVHNIAQYGVIPYHCTLHPQMVGAVVVV